MLRLILLVWLALCASAAAQVVTVRSGEHDGFTRLVLTFPEPGGWDLGRTGDGYAFRARATRWRYDISTVFDLIPRDRLSALWVDPESGALRMGLGCDCHAIATPFRAGIVVVDIKPGPAPENSPYEQAIANAGASVPPVAAPATVRPRQRPGDFLPPLPASVPTVVIRPETRLPALRLPDARAADLQTRLLREMSRGIAAGALEAAATPIRVPTEPDSSGPRLLPIPSGPEAPTTHLRLHPAQGDPDQALSASGQTCISDDRLDIPAWGNDQPPAAQIASARARLLGEFDKPDPDKVIVLARLYIHIGFGAEAQAELKAWSPFGPDIPLLTSLAAIVDGRHATTIFDGMHGCNGRAALWSVLANPVLPDPARTDRAAVLRAFSELPLGLRRQIGIPLADRLLAAGMTDDAQSVRDGIGRAIDRPDETLAILDAGLHLRSGEPVAAEKDLDHVVGNDGPMAARALAALVESQIARGLAPDAAQVLQLDSMLHEQRGSMDEPALRQALAKALVLDGQAARALGQLAAADPTIIPSLWELLAKNGDDMSVIEQAASAGDAARDLPAPIRRTVAKRLIDAGFPGLASNWLTGLTDDASVLLQAHAALATRDARASLRILAGHTGTEAETLRARALEQLGDLPTAHAAWIAAGNQTEAERTLRLSGRWSELGPAADPQIAPLLAAQTTVEDGTDTAQGQLARTRQLLDSSGATRSAIGALLATREIP